LIFSLEKKGVFSDQHPKNMKRGMKKIFKGFGVEFSAVDRLKKEP